jgi:hypothetical protein
MALARRVVELGHLQRQKEGVNLRKPLASMELFVPSTLDAIEAQAVLDLIRDELNIKSVTVTAKPELFAVKVKPNFVPLRKDFDKATLPVKIKFISTLSANQVSSLVDGTVEEIEGVRKEHLLIEDDSSHLGTLDSATKRSFLGC